MDDGEVVGESFPEKHYDLIDSEDKVQIYESIMLDKHRNATTDLLRAWD